MTGALVKLLRESHGLEVSTLAARANIRLAALQAIEAGTKVPTTRELVSLGRVLNVAPERLAPMAAGSLEALPEWQGLRESLYQHGQRYGMADVQKYLVVMVHAWGREVARVKQTERKTS